MIKVRIKKDDKICTYLLRPITKEGATPSKRMKMLGLEYLEQVPIEELSTLKIIKKNNILEVQDEICSICHSTFVIKNYCRLLACNHLFHHKCIKSWYDNNITCPICRQILEPTLR